ncbi:MAG: TerC family protein [Bacteroidota bacterium]|nr:TerC family protein [Bacteroidota bacterium]
MNLDLHSFISLLILTVMEVALCIDNAIFISILSGRIKDKTRRAEARTLGIIVALVINIVMVSFIHLHEDLQLELFEILGHPFSIKDVILIAGGTFLIANSTIEIHNKMEGSEEDEDRIPASNSFWFVMVKITVMNIVFSFDSVLTAIAMVHDYWKMIFAISVALSVMYFFIRPIDYFLKKHPSLKILALSFLMLIGLVLIMDGLEEKIDKGYVYFAMAFSVFVEVINIMVLRRSKKSVALHERHIE